MTPAEFAAKWKGSTLKERAGYQEHWRDLCAMLDRPTPTEVDTSGDEYTFEKGAGRTSGGGGWADVWRRDRFGVEYKGKHKDLKAAYAQLLDYREALGNPPLLIVTDMARFEVHSNFTGTQKRVYAFVCQDGESAPDLKFIWGKMLTSSPRILIVAILLFQVRDAEWKRTKSGSGNIQVEAASSDVP